MSGGRGEVTQEPVALERVALTACRVCECSYQTGRNGFEGAHAWQSEIGKKASLHSVGLFGLPPTLWLTLVGLLVAWWFGRR